MQVDDYSLYAHHLTWVTMTYNVALGYRLTQCR